MKKNCLIILFSVLYSAIHFLALSYGDILNNWKDPSAYKPNPVLFAHGFAKGAPEDWNSAKDILKLYLSKYNNIYSYLETVAFNDPNGSIDTYDNGKPGWSDTLSDFVSRLLKSDSYGNYTNTINLVCHSMGGLAGRWYLANYSNEHVDKIILIGVPNKGSNLASLAGATVGLEKIGWIFGVNEVTVSAYAAAGVIELYVIFSQDINIHSEAVKDMLPASGFLDKLNLMPQPSNVSYFAIVGLIGNWMNLISGNYYGGDGVVSKDSQLGVRYVNLKDSLEVTSDHANEPIVAAKTNVILKFLDSTKPEVEIISPTQSQQAVILTNPTVNIKGKIYKEYLPADSKLHIKVSRDALSQPVIDEKRIDAIKPSSLWKPKDASSPVAEFDEDISLPGTGIYAIDISVINPAGLESDAQTVMAMYLGPSTWQVGPYSPAFEISGAYYTLNSNLNIIFHPSDYTNPFPGASIEVSVASASQINTPLDVTDVIVLINDDAILSNGPTMGMQPCKITFSKLELRLNGHVSGVITGTVKGDINNDGEWETYSLNGPFTDVLVTLAKNDTESRLLRRKFRLITK